MLTKIPTNKVNKSIKPQGKLKQVKKNQRTKSNQHKLCRNQREMKEIRIIIIKQFTIKKTVKSKQKKNQRENWNKWRKSNSKKQSSQINW